ncbi:hypothetical protein PAMP_022933 [Pampus punctatissimus]
MACHVSASRPAAAPLAKRSPASKRDGKACRRRESPQIELLSQRTRSWSFSYGVNTEIGEQQKQRVSMAATMQCRSHASTAFPLVQNVPREREEWRSRCAWSLGGTLFRAALLHFLRLSFGIVSGLFDPFALDCRTRLRPVSEGGCAENPLPPPTASQHRFSANGSRDHKGRVRAIGPLVFCYPLTDVTFTPDVQREEPGDGTGACSVLSTHRPGIAVLPGTVHPSDSVKVKVPAPSCVSTGDQAKSDVCSQALCRSRPAAALLRGRWEMEQGLAPSSPRIGPVLQCFRERCTPLTL